MTIDKKISPLSTFIFLTSLLVSLEGSPYYSLSVTGTPLTISNNLIIENTLFIPIKELTVTHSVTLEGPTIIIGNNTRQLILKFSNLPEKESLSENTNFLMLNPSTQQLYLGNKESPHPAPDYLVLDALSTQTIIPLDAASITCNTESTHSTAIGNSLSSLVCYAHHLILEGNNTETYRPLKTTNTEKKLSFESPITLQSSLETAGTITINEGLSLSEAAKVTGTQSTWENITVGGDTLLGSETVSSTIKTTEALSLAPETVSLGSQSLPITHVTGTALLPNPQNTFYHLLINRETNTLKKAKIIEHEEEKETITQALIQTKEITPAITGNLLFSSPTMTFMSQENSLTTPELICDKTIFSLPVTLTNITQIDDSVIFEAAQKTIISSDSTALNSLRLAKISFKGKTIFISGTPIEVPDPLPPLLCLTTDNALALFHTEDFISLENIGEDIFTLSQNNKALRKKHEELAKRTEEITKKNYILLQKIKKYKKERKKKQ
jgi:hypothetical protein